MLPSQRFFIFLTVVNSAICAFCEVDDRTLEHMFWDCAKIQVFWPDFKDRFIQTFPTVDSWLQL